MVNYPELRNIEAFPLEDKGIKSIYLRDPEGFNKELFVLDEKYVPLLMLLDGNHSLIEIQSLFLKQTGIQLSDESIASLIEDLDKKSFYTVKLPNFTPMKMGLACLVRPK